MREGHTASRRRPGRAVALVAGVALLAACGNDAADLPTERASPSSNGTADRTDTRASGSPVAAPPARWPTATSVAPSAGDTTPSPTGATPAPAPPAPPPPPPPEPAGTPTATDPPAPVPPPAVRFSYEIRVIDDAAAARMTASWREGCPVPLSDLRILRLAHVGYDGDPHSGELVVHADVAEPVVTVFRTLFEAGFPIERMELVDVYGGSDDASMAANNTSAFNCRPATGSDRWSEHAYGRAIDVNPLVNPYVAGSYVAPPGGAPYVDRSVDVPGMIRADDVVVRAFASIGWGWGGSWTSVKDYQHFSASGR